MIKPILMMEKFIHMCKSPIKCWCTNEILFSCMSSNFLIEILHKKLVLESNKCSRVEVKNLWVFGSKLLKPLPINNMSISVNWMSICFNTNYNAVVMINITKAIWNSSRERKVYKEIYLIRLLLIKNLLFSFQDHQFQQNHIIYWDSKYA